MRKSKFSGHPIVGALKQVVPCGHADGLPIGLRLAAGPKPWIGA